uniref:kelch-like protein 10 n=1 Tax=Myxine glutinosa TaxID=7769 RepID=UPI00358F8622
MTGRRSGVIKLIQDVAPEASWTHCFLHREALAAKEMSPGLAEVMDIAVKTINHLRKSALNSRLFAELCKEQDAEHTTVLYFAAVRWLSRGDALARFTTMEMTQEMKEKWWDTMNEQRLEGFLCDAILKVDGVTYNVHKDVMCTFSGYFRTLFAKTNYGEQQREFVIRGLTSDIMHFLIQFAYMRSVHITEENVEGLFAAASQFDLPKVTHLCCNFLEGQVCPDNCIGIYKFAQSYFCSDLEQNIFKFILVHFKHVVKSQEFLELSVDQLDQIISQDTLNVNKEEVVFHAIVTWIGHHADSRKTHMERLFPKVSLVIFSRVWCVIWVIHTEDTFSITMAGKDDGRHLVDIGIMSRPDLGYIVHISGVHQQLLLILKDGEPARLHFAALVHGAFDPHVPGHVGVGVACDGLSEVRFGVANNDRLIDMAKCNEYVKNSKICCNILRFSRNVHLMPNCDSILTRPRLPYSILFAFGGWNRGAPTNAIETYNTRFDTWVNVTIEEEAPRANFETAYLDGLIYVVGGFDSVNYFSDARCFDPVNCVWLQIAPMYIKRCYISLAVHDGLIYALGGFDGETRLNSAECYNPRTNQWINIPPMNEIRSDSGATVLNGKIYMCGGFNGNHCMSSAEYFSPEANKWMRIAGMNTCRSGVGVITYNNLVFAVGGCDGEDRLHSIEAYDPSSNTWTLLESMFNPRSNFGLEVLDDLLFVVGGYNGVIIIDDVEFYDHVTNEWHDASDMSISRSGLSCCVVENLPNVHLYISHH